MEIRKIIVADYEDGMEIKTINQAVRGSTSAIYRLLEKNRKTGTIKPSYENIGRQSEVTQDKLIKMNALVTENPGITLAEIKEAMHLSIQKSEISNILRNKLGFRYKKCGTCQRAGPGRCKSQTYCLE